jgi:hypothetical protein
MEDCLKLMKKYRNLSESTLKTYKRILNTMALDITGEEFKDKEFILTHYDLVMDYLNIISDSSRRVYICAILALISKEKGNYYPNFQYVAEELSDWLLELQIGFDEIAVTQQKSPYQLENWTSMKELNSIREGVFDELLLLNVYDFDEKNKKKIKKKKKLLQKYVLMSMLLLLPPRRTSDYATLKYLWVGKTTPVLDNGNYLVIKDNSMYLSFSQYKTRKHYGIQAVDIGEDLEEILRLYIKYNNLFGRKTDSNTYVFYNETGAPYTTSNMTRYIITMFNDTDKHITTNLIRHIYLSEKYDPNLQERLEDAHKMGHSIETAMKHYIKH